MHNCVKQQEQQQSPLNQSWKTYGEESLEIAPTDEDEILDQSDLAERMIDAEKKFSTSSINTSRFESQHFDHPALYRVLFMGSVTEDKKKDLFKKLSQGFAHVSQQQNRPDCKNLSFLGQPILPFKEIKHNIVLLSEDDGNDNNLVSDSFEDIGVSMIEADFTWNSNAVNYSNDPTNLLLQYAWNQCPNAEQLPSAWIGNRITKTKFTGYTFPEKTPNGIDLCVYFYDGPNDEKRTKDDLELLCLLRKLGTYVLPLTATRDESMKGHFADLLTKYKVRCLDLGNFEVGQEPSFFHHRKYTDDRLSRIQGMECTQSNIPRVATYQILSVDQFCSIENKAIFELLKRTRDRQRIHDELRNQFKSSNEYKNEESTLSNSSHNSSPSNSDVIVTEEKKPKVYINSFIQGVLFSLVAVGAMNWTYKYSTETQSPIKWTASFDLNSTFAFNLYTKDENGQSNWSDPEPQVWLNHHQSIPIVKEKIVGKYHLVFDPLLLNNLSENFIPIVFSINHTNLDFSYTETRPTFVLYNMNRDKKDTSMQVEQNKKNNNERLSKLNNYTLNEEDENSTGILQKTWRTLVFIKENYSNIKKIIIKE